MLSIKPKPRWLPISGQREQEAEGQREQDAEEETVWILSYLSLREMDLLAAGRIHLILSGSRESEAEMSPKKSEYLATVGPLGNRATDRSQVPSNWAVEPRWKPLEIGSVVVK